MEFRTITARTKAGQVLAGADVTVFRAGTETQVKVYDENGTALVTATSKTDANGQLGFKVGNGQYDVRASLGTTVAQIENLEFNFPLDFADRATLSAYWFDGIHPDGTIVSDGKVQYMALFGASYTGLPAGLVPFGDVTADHFGENTVPGTTNMTSAGQAAIDYVASLGGGRVNFLRGTYLTTGFTGKNKVSLRGAGKHDTVLKLANGTDANVFKADGTLATVGDFSISDLTIDGNKANQSVSDSTTIGLYLYECDDVTIENVKLVDCSYDGLRIERSRDTRVVKCDAINNDEPGIRPFVAERCTITECLCEGNRTDGIDVDAFSKQVTVTKNICRNNTREGIFVEEGSSDVIVSDNICEGNTKGINVNDQLVTGLRNITIADNILRLNDDAGIRVAANTASATLVRDIVISGNQCYLNNQAVGGTAPGISLRADTGVSLNRVIVSNNRCGGGTSETQTYGLRINSTDVSNVLLIGNDFTGNALGEIDGVGTGTMIATMTPYPDSGTFTPTLVIGGASTGITYAAQDGVWRRVGNLVWFSALVTLTSKGALTGGVRIGELPFSNTGSSVMLGSVRMANSTGSIVGLSAEVLTATRQARLQYNPISGSTDLTDASLTNTTSIRISGFYAVA